MNQKKRDRPRFPGGYNKKILTPRHREIMIEVISGNDRPKTIARKLGISHRTVEVLLFQIRSRLGVSSITQAAIKFMAMERDDV